MGLASESPWHMLIDKSVTSMKITKFAIFSKSKQEHMQA